jgi:hypothetical protein
VSELRRALHARSYDAVIDTQGLIKILDGQDKTPEDAAIENAVFVTSPDGNSWLPDAVSAAYNFSLTYDYYLEHHNRNSLDGKGGNILAIVRIADEKHNAAWSSAYQLMIFGDDIPLAAGLDVIGHELTHGFDDQGRQFDAKGNLRDWWTKEDGEQFEKRAQCIVDQYAQYTIVDDIKINSKLTEGEDVADLGGLILAYLAWKAGIQGQQLENRDGFTPDQRFFIGYAQWACENQRPENLRANAITNEHSPGKYRVNGLVVNIPEFQQAFGCKAGQPMVRENRCRVW